MQQRFTDKEMGILASKSQNNGISGERTAQQLLNHAWVTMGAQKGGF
jgi:hypothetical protein